MVKRTEYFSHDANARTDPKIMQMRSVYGCEGYGWYWMFIEKLRCEAEYKLSMQGKYVFNAFASEFNTDASRIKAFIEDCICEFKLFASDDEYFWSNSLLERMKEMEDKSEKARKSAEARWGKKNKPEENQGSEQSQCDGNANASKSDAIKEKKLKEIKLKENNINIPYAEIIDYLNLKASAKYKHGISKTQELIQARFNQGFTLEDFKTVIDKKCNEWLDTEQAKYLRPETLFGTKFESYLNQIVKGGSNGKPIGNSQSDFHYEGSKWNGETISDDGLI
jgi:uncharacterized phage protein (TIGR02220 family)